ncbi:hypothetical protein ACHQM5_013170 [Ranunculus cassubicifolius]
MALHRMSLAMYTLMIINQVMGQPGCIGDYGLLVAPPCWDYVKLRNAKSPPSEECCISYRQANIPCVCKSIGDQEEQNISTKRIAYIAAYCGTPLAPGTQCGSYTVPNA